MMTIRPVSDLRNKFPEIEEAVLQDNEPVFLTKNGYGTMVLMSIEQYSALTDAVEKKLDEADVPCHAVYDRGGAEIYGWFNAQGLGYSHGEGLRRGAELRRGRGNGGAHGR